MKNILSLWLILEMLKNHGFIHDGNCYALIHVDVYEGKDSEVLI